MRAFPAAKAVSRSSRGRHPGRRCELRCGSRARFTSSHSRAGISLVIADSYARIFFRNRSHGLPDPPVASAAEGSRKETSSSRPREGIVRNFTKASEYRCEAFPVHERAAAHGRAGAWSQAAGKSAGEHLLRGPKQNKRPTRPPRAGRPTPKVVLQEPLGELAAIHPIRHDLKSRRPTDSRLRSTPCATESRCWRRHHPKRQVPARADVSDIALHHGRGIPFGLGGRARDAQAGSRGTQEGAS